MNQMRPDIKSESASLQSSIVHDLVFYDGHCGLCHGLVLFVLARDQEGKNFRFAPLGGKTFERLISQERRQTLPDSIVLLSHSGEVYTRSAAIIKILSKLDGLWPLSAKLLSIVPRALNDFVYDLIARVRRKLFARPEDVCPVIPQHLRSRFCD